MTDVESVVRGENLVVFRAHKVDDRIRELLRSLAASLSGTLVLVVDETSAISGGVDVPKLSLRRDTLAELGPVDFEKPAWRCGDYALYLA